MCLRCVFMTRHEYGADRSSAAAANDGMLHVTASASLLAKDDTAAVESVALSVDTSPDIFMCLGLSSACSKFAILFGETGREMIGDFRFQEGYGSMKAFKRVIILPPSGQEGKRQQDKLMTTI